MADVTRTRGRRDGDERRRSRGQLILVGGLVVAIGLVALVLLLNTVLFAENVATRGIAPGGDRAADHAAFAEHAGTAILEAEDRPASEPADWPTARGNVEADVERVGELATNRSLQRHRAYTTLSVNDSTRGAALVQNASGEFRSDDGSENWTLSRGTDGIRRFTTTVDAGEMTTDAFAVEIEGDGSTTWRAEVNATSGDEVRVTAVGSTCNSSASAATIDWTAGTLGDCSFPFAVDASGAALEGPLTLRFVNGSNGHGTYFLVVENSGGAVVDANFGAAGSGQSPRQYPVVYSLFIDALYDDLDVTYETTVRVAPGESAQTRPEP